MLHDLLTASIAPSPTNPRRHWDPARHAELVESVRALGVLSPVLVRLHPEPDSPAMYQLVCGHRRLRAAQEAGLESIPAIVRELDDAHVLELQITENLQREDVHPLEEAEGFEALMGRHGYSVDDIAAKTGKSRSYVYGRLKLCDLCPEARERYYAGGLSAATALLVARIPVPGLQAKAAGEISASGWQKQPMSARDALAHIQSRYMLRLAEATWPLDDATLVPVAGSCTTCPNRSGNQAALFGEAVDAGDLCQLASCYEGKRAAQYQRRRAIAERLGQRIVEGAAARDLMPWDGDFRDSPEHLTALDEVCDWNPPGDAEADDDCPSVRAAAGPHLDPKAVVIVATRDGDDWVEAAPESAIHAALRRAGLVPPEESRPERGVHVDPESRRGEVSEREAKRAAAEAWAEAETQWRTRVWDELRRVDRMTVQSIPRTLWVAFTVAALNDLDWAMMQRLAERWERPQEGDDDMETEDRWRDELHNRTLWPSHRLARLALDATLIDEVHARSWQHERDDAVPRTLLALAAEWGIDVEALRTPEAGRSSLPAAEDAPGEDAAPAPKPKRTRKPKAAAAPAPAPIAAAPASETKP